MDRLIFLERIHAYAPLPPAATDALSASLRRRSAPEGAAVASPRSAAEQPVIMIASGIARLHVVTDDGHDVTRCFVRAEDFVLPQFGPTAEGPRETLSAVTDLTYVTVPFPRFEALMAEHPRLAHFYGHLLAERDLAARDRAERSARHEPVATYERFLRAFPGLEGHVPTAHLASFLGLSPGEFMRARQKYRDRGIM